MAEIKNIKIDRMRYTKNKFSSNLALIAIVFNVLYYVSIYSSDVGKYYYTIMIGFSVLCNLVFLLAAFLCSEGVKNYNIRYAYVLIVLGALQAVRILGIPKRAHSATVKVTEGTEVIETLVMGDKQFAYVVACLVISGAACVIAGIVGIYKTYTLEKYKKENGLD